MSSSVLPPLPDSSPAQGRPPRPPATRVPVLVTPAAVEELLEAARDRLGIVQRPAARTHIEDAIRAFEDVLEHLALADMRCVMAALDGYPTFHPAGHAE